MHDSFPFDFGLENTFMRNQRPVNFNNIIII